MSNLIDTGCAILGETEFDFLNHIGIRIHKSPDRVQALKHLFNGESVIISKARLTGVSTLLGYYCACIIKITKERPFILAGTYSMQIHLERIISDMVGFHSWKSFPFSGVVVVDESSFLSMDSFIRQLIHCDVNQIVVSGLQFGNDVIESLYQHIMNRLDNGCYISGKLFKFNHVVSQPQSISYIRKLGNE